MNPIEQKLINEIIQAIQELKGYLVEERQVQIQIPKDHQNGDYSSNIAMRLAKVFQQKPIELATELAAYLEQKSDLIEKAEVAGPGFLNFWVKQDELTSVISKVIEMDQDYGRNDSGNQLKINVEYISVNPTGLLHMGHARGAAWGDSITRLMKFSNYEVTREYYVNDGGNQIEALVYSLLERYKQFHGLDYQLPEDGYHSEDLLEIVEQLNQRHGREFLDWPLAKQLAVLEDEGVELELARIKSDLKKFNVEMDVYTSEKAIREQFDMEDLLEQLRQAGYVYQEDGAQWFKSSVFGDDKDRVLKKSDGTYTYLTPDILYHKYKLDRGFKKLINIFGADHHGYIPRLKAAIQAIGYDTDTLEVDIIQIVRMIEDGQEVRMSKRTGNAITLTEMIEDIGLDAVRYFMVSRAADTHFDFDIELAKSQSNDNPVYYAQYAHARMCSIEARKQNLSLATSYNLLTHEKEIDLMKWILSFSDVVAEAAASRLPNKICNYVQKLAQLFHTFYASCKVLDFEQTELSGQRLALVKATQITLRNALHLIGVSAPEEM